MSKKPVVLMVLDGYGLNDRTEGNAIAMANTPVMDKLMKECPFQKGYASGLAVGLPDGQMGNSEVGHYLRQWRTARRMIRIFTFSDFYQMVVFTVI